jgi:hypothetical protein
MTKEHSVIFHYHIFKNAGTSVDSALKHFFGSEWSAFEGAHAHDILPPSSVAKFLEENPRVRAVSSHLARLPTPFINIKPIVFLRNPLLRAKSVYEFTRCYERQPFFDLISKMSFIDYLEWVLGGAAGGVVIRDYQVIHLSSASFCIDGILSAKATQINLDEAKKTVADLPAIGLVESFERSMKLFEKVYEPFIPEIKLHVTHKNRSGNCRFVEEVENELPKEILEEFNKQNMFDYSLHEYANQKFIELCHQYNC